MYINTKSASSTQFINAEMRYKQEPLCIVKVIEVISYFSFFIHIYPIKKYQAFKIKYTCKIIFQ